MKQVKLTEIEKIVMETLKKVVEDSSKNDDDFLNSNYSDNGMLDSIAFVTLVVELEEIFDISIDDEYLQLKNLSTFNAITNMVKTLIELKCDSNTQQVDNENF
ncbi:acyl carrier protein [Bacillus cereus group sp. Bc002]|uniref:acyl carrier protein n=1 Tax=unclassified Bacillus cereus group TaxID=2750818 RepID=UPI0022DF5CB7|nr:MULTISPECIES: acyl carrier protein [unclassified Bacillus cereus group]MDA2139016.1 acyl carrier protein [Bacillus cereus group sp. Bc256]MDA2782820.1 acyl carrier protein [Bacillus cereus group sp. Bc002]